MKKQDVKKIKEISEYVEVGIRELGDEENIRIDATTIFKERRQNMPQSVFVLQNFARKFSSEITLSSSTNRIFWHFISLMEYENLIKVDIQTIGENLKMHKTTVMKGVQELVNLNIVIKFSSKQDKRRNEYSVNPLTMWKGKSENRRKAIKKFEKNNATILELPFNDDKRL